MFIGPCIIAIVDESPTWCHLLYYFTYYELNIFRTLIYPSSGACDCVDELPNQSPCSQFVVCWSFCCGWYLVVFVLQDEACKNSYHSFSVSSEEWSRNKETTIERQNTGIGSFDLKSPRISAFDVNEWIYKKITRAGKGGEHGTDRRAATPSVHQIRWVTVLAGITAHNSRSVRIQTWQWGNITG
jgi:hypothetical protein